MALLEMYQALFEHSCDAINAIAPLTPGECDQFLQDTCPACFGGRLWGRSFQDRGDVHVSTNGNFHHKHYKSAGDTPPFLDLKHILPKAYVDDIKEHVLAVRCHERTRKAKLPDEAVDACEESHQAAKPERKSSQLQFNDHGLMSLVCHHDIPILFANIDTAGEGQQYPVYELFPSDLNDHLQFATTAMHAYAHQWSCLALTDGEGAERIWSALRALIAITRHSSVS
ncbi:hypothetical protein C8J56DRAFT_1000125 [Mycena floridula]|nr:hypothetical protein C8J56DRAFT_1000125 [Mycena floridula]